MLFATKINTILSFSLPCKKDYIISIILSNNHELFSNLFKSKQYDQIIFIP